MDNRICVECGFEKSLNDFPKFNKKNKTYYLHNCKKCKYQHKLHCPYMQTDKFKENRRLAYKKWNKNNKEKKKLHTKKYYELNKEKIYLYVKKFRELNKKEITSFYVKSLLTANTTLKFNDIPQELMEFKKLHLQLKRMSENENQKVK